MYPKSEFILIVNLLLLAKFLFIFNHIISHYGKRVDFIFQNEILYTNILKIDFVIDDFIL